MAGGNKSHRASFGVYLISYLRVLLSPKLELQRDALSTDKPYRQSIRTNIVAWIWGQIRPAIFL